MAKLFLTSCGFLTEEIKNQFIKLLPENRTGMKVTIITTASVQQKNKNKYIQKAKNDFQEMGFKQVEFMDIEFEEPTRLKQYDVVYIAGGNPFYLLHHVRKSGANEILKEMTREEVLIVGVSAGSMILGDNIQLAHLFTSDINTVNMTDYTALQLINRNIFPHYDRNDLFSDGSEESIEERLQNFEAKYQNKILRLKDNETTTISLTNKRI
ncbi:Type 1 glutamine amidotransferase-like domain-containing protein [Bacillus sp. EAC]|uniref:Type 1 glutamine amidotransferase-like domain-containing protein n=1 Tax=Bacillus sp. EAC TaxID=1978338 RepID=UPI000B42EC7A|nr:Type 1 glutamine amidotransferase-like domain-containing protein [Bacillus sp. EAC]